MYKFIGWAAIATALFALVLGVLPGAMSIIATYIAFIALLASIVTVRSKVSYFKMVATITAIGIFVINDSVRLYDSLPQISWQYQLSVYGLFIIVSVIGIGYAKRNAMKSDNST